MQQIEFLLIILERTPTEDQFSTGRGSERSENYREEQPKEPENIMQVDIILIMKLT